MPYLAILPHEQRDRSADGLAEFHAEGSVLELLLRDGDGGVHGLWGGDDGEAVKVAEDGFQTALGVGEQVFGAPTLKACAHSTQGSTKSIDCKSGW